MKQLGYYLYSLTLSCHHVHKNTVLSKLLENGRPFYGSINTDDGIRFEMSYFDYIGSGIEKYCKIEDIGGAFGYIMRRSDRVGLLVGAIIFAVCIYVSSLFVWDIKIADIEGMERNEIEEILSLSGLNIGDYIPSIDIEQIQLNVLMNTDKLSYITLNIDGCTVSADGAARQNRDEAANDTSVANIVASEDGQIVGFMSKRGRVCRAVGDVVQKGELLISGIYEDEKMGMCAERAEGEVYAEVSRHIQISYPCTVYEKTNTENISHGLSLSVFGKKIDVYKCDEYELYDEYVQKENLTLFGVRLPVLIYRTHRYEYWYEKRVFDEKEVYRRAWDEYEQRLKEETEGCEMVEKQLNISSDEGGCTITCNLTLIKNIAETTHVPSY